MIFIDSGKLRKKIKNRFRYHWTAENMRRVLTIITNLESESEQMRCQNCKSWLKWVLFDDGYCDHLNNKVKRKADFFCKHFKREELKNEKTKM